MRQLIVIKIVLWLSLAISGVAQASALKRAEPKDVKMLLNAATGMNSAYWASYIGETRGKVFISYETAVHSSSLVKSDLKLVVYWLPASELSEKDHKQFKEYQLQHQARRQK